ncbi:MAG: mechanosensitive ion channel family protein [Lentimicrobium sp.]|jgi:small-conductance mechanosensitive channel|nr:mechanosensitive ion channel family protein [Lentimicrobium sp.]MDD2527415.1 mechanosensitive ion channel [Lentimicrobiaceae bacterium]MDD4597585.1 mechanosensitive ion channel [Lentimicrobiaceae bacterium]MDY0026199.1 mechanosensitive ion channel [Lentimicrobium sp.]HAH56672.1 transporter [Bacteroidales bacterium]
MEQIKEFFVSELGIKIITILVSLILIYILASLIKKIIPRYISASESRYKTRKFVNIVGYVLFIIIILTVFSNQLTGLTVFLGVAGAGIAFALQEVIASIAGYIAIHTSNFYKVGDRVMVGGIIGDVIDIRMLRTSLMETGGWINGDLYNGRITTVANSFVFSEPVHNYSGEFPFLWDELIVPIKTSSDFEYGREVFFQILKNIQSEYAVDAQQHWRKMTGKFLVEKAKVEPMISMSFDENWISFTLRYVVDYKARRSTRDILSTEILRAIKNSGGKLEVGSTAMEITAFPHNKQ